MKARFARPLASALALLLAVAAPAAEPRLDLYGDPLPEGALARLGTLRFRTTEDPHEVRVSPDGKRIAARGEAGLVVFDAGSGRVVRDLRHAPGRGGPFAWLPDGSGLLLWSDNPRNPRLVDFTDPDLKLPAFLPAPEAKQVEKKGDGPAVTPASERPGVFAFSADGGLLAAEAYDPQTQARSVTVREAASGKRLRELRLVRDLGGTPSECVALRFTRDGRALGALCKSGERKECLFGVWDLRTGKERGWRTAPPCLGLANRGCFDLSPDGRRLAIGLGDGTARLFDLAGDSGPGSFARHARSGGHGSSHGVSALAFSPDGKLLVTAGLDNMLRGWDPATLEEVRPARNAGEGVWSIDFSPDGKRVVTAGYGHTVRQWDAATFREAEVAAGHFGFVLCAKVSPDGKTVVTTGGDETLRAWDLDAGRERRRIDTGGWIARGMAWRSGDRIAVPGRIGSHLALAADGKTALLTVDQTLRAWDMTTGAKVALPGGLARAGRFCYGFGPGGRTLILADRGSVALWDWPSGRRLRSFEFTDVAGRAAPDAFCLGADVSADGALLAVSHGRTGKGGLVERRTDVWDTATGERVVGLVASGLEDVFPRFLPSGQALALAAWYGWTPEPPGEGMAPALSLWDSRTGKRRQTFAASRPDVAGRPLWYVGDVAVSPDGRTLAAAGDNGAVLYEVASGQVRRHLRHDPMALGVAFTPDGRRLVTSGSDCNALVWDTTPAGSAKRAGPLTDGERRGLWATLSVGPAQAAFEAMARFAADGPETVAFLKEHLRPIPKLDKAIVDQLFTDMESDRFAVRQRASAELDRLGRLLVEPARARVEKASTQDGRERLMRYLDKHAEAGPTPEELRQARAVELLESIASSEARAVLHELVGGDPAALLTRDAAESLRRLAR